MADDDVNALVKEIVDTPKEAAEYLKGVLRKQGLGG
jgi:hypothetical protein